MRKQPAISPPALKEKDNSALIIQRRIYEVITPLFGGGVTPNEPGDPVTVIRGTEVRAHLRFWWRACRYAQFEGELAKMKQAEGVLWGAAHKKATTEQEKLEEKERQGKPTVQISVEVLERGESKAAYARDKKNQKVPVRDVAPYAVFPLQETEGSVRHGVTFELTISYPAEKSRDIKAALWAWETFGGIGARTRRGFGALHLLKVDGKEASGLSTLKSPDEVRTWITTNLSNYVLEGKELDKIPYLRSTSQFKLLFVTAKPVESWKILIDRLCQFRQFRYGRFGASRWPEPEAIRMQTGIHPEDPQKLHKFPRAAFGLPIVFHFKQPKNGIEPKDTTLQGAQSGQERLASPLILRPLVYGSNAGNAVGLALLLEGPRTPPGGLQLAPKGKSPSVESKLTHAESKKTRFLNGETDILQAFMNGIKEGWDSSR